ncbi:DUF2800 domain-containing protein [Clostridium sporogenes]|uniref:DUF2800 domain-containing protein n=1 Tax=Clostridium sporogenes TaxID=1509 RepID=UPI0013D34D39|nr:DUF2800 domain-containing protein [Clostridium sporogenes]NFF65946.1 DUF2800 domain-containing protein [Clostridium sporogenes]NFF98335.1 DUF2800 domain-containing protein [Clostridium sporogenes]NFG05413.1 DUF2800 domain-containing protein [Clostridium sporogenes]NFG50916.1 DUF2800 domain-containing protein [Clostridium sporogenes]NFP83252.1 DUF2800 domain-containing protein [Clostridium sporogenes]
MSGSYNEHSKFSPSAAHRILACTPSMVLEQQFPNETSTYAEEGTAAHDLSEHKLKKALKMRSRKLVSKYDSDEMDEYTDTYVEYCLGIIEKAKENCKDLQILIEQKLDFSDYVEGGFGTGDLVIVGTGTLHVIDFKYGRGVIVAAEKNPQMMLYALGALSLFDMLYDIKKVTMTIVQPRVDNFSTYEITVDELLKWAEEELKPKAELALKGEGEFCPGEHCRFCKAKNQCRAREVKNLELLKYEFRDPALLSDDEIAEIMGVAEELSKWASDIYTYATALAINEGKNWDGFKLVEGRTRRKYTDEEAVAEAAKGAGYSDIYKKNLISITEMEKLMGKKKFKDILGSFVEKPKGKLTLVSDTDKRNAVDVVAAEFKVEE